MGYISSHRIESQLLETQLSGAIHQNSKYLLSAVQDTLNRRGSQGLVYPDRVGLWLEKLPKMPWPGNAAILLSI